MENDKPRFTNIEISQVIFYESEEIQSIILKNLNKVRFNKVRELMASYKNSENETDKTRVWKIKRKVLKSIQMLAMQGKIIVPDCDSLSLNQNYRNIDEEAKDINDDFPVINLFKSSFKEIINYWVTVCHHVRVNGQPTLNIILDKMADEYCSKLLEFSMDDIKEYDIKMFSKKLQLNEVNKYRKKLDIIKRGISLMLKGLGYDEILFECYKLIPEIPVDHNHEREKIKSLTDPFVTDGMDYSEIIRNIAAFKMFIEKDGLIYIEKFIENPNVKQNQCFIAAMDLLITTNEYGVIKKVIENKKQALIREFMTKMQMFEAVCITLNKGKSSANPHLLYAYLYSFLPDALNWKNYFGSPNV
ncbi:MAG: hypothetical protein H7844_11890 [Nitrospirae bacterium YQR-1]